MKPFKIWCETEKEKRAVLKKMEREGIRWLSGRKPSSVDCCAPIALFVNIDGSLWKRESKLNYATQCAYQSKSVREFLGEQEKIIIYRDDRKVIALDKRTGKKAEARCNPSDTFDFGIGARIAFARLIQNKEPASPEPKAFTGKAVYLGGDEVNDQFFTIGKIYEFIDGKVRDNDDDLRPSGSCDQCLKFGVTHDLRCWHFLPIVD